MTTTRERSAGTALLVLGGFNALFGAVGMFAGGVLSAFGLAALAGLVFVVLGLGVRNGSRQAIIVAAVLLGLLLVWQLVQLVLDPGTQLAVRVLITGAVTALVIRAQRGA